MIEVKSYQDNRGQLHKTAFDAVRHDFIYAMQKAWDCLPARNSMGNPAMIADEMTSLTYRGALTRLRDAINEYITARDALQD